MSKVLISSIKEAVGVPRRFGDIVFKQLTMVCAVFVLLLIVAMGWQLTQSAMPAVKLFGFDFLSAKSWDPVMGEFGAAPSLWGTLISSFLALLIAVPVSLGVAIFLTQIAPSRSEEHTSELQSRPHLVCRLLLEKKKKKYNTSLITLLIVKLLLLLLCLLEHHLPLLRQPRFF